MPSHSDCQGEKESLDDASQLYGPAWSPALAAMGEALQQKAADIADEFYSRLLCLPDARRLIEALSDSELQRFKSQQIENLLMLAAPDLTAAKHRAIALQVGRAHFIVGLQRKDLVCSRDILHASVRRHVDVDLYGDALSILVRRLIRDLAWQMEAYQQLQAARNKVLVDITQLAWKADSYTDLIGNAAKVLGAHEEIVGCSFGRPDKQGLFRFESVSGSSVESYLAALEQSEAGPIMTGNRAQGRGPTGRAWYSGKVEHCINFATDARMSPWRVLAEQRGIRSSAAIPLCQPDAAPMAVLTLYSAFPGGYTAPDQLAFVSQLQNLLVFAIARIEVHQGRTYTVPYATRQRWTTLLRSDALEMYYQPLLELGSCEVRKVEVLARLWDGDRLLVPGVFLPVLSSDDFLELYVRGLGKALAQRHEWLQRGLDLDISINLPPKALGDSRYYDATRRILLEHGCPGERLTLELLETDDVPSGVDVEEELARFKALNVNLAEDDLGAGHSSLTRLRRLPFDSVKIDRSITALAGEDSSTVLRFIFQLTRLGHSLGKSVVVEGVENEDLLEAVTLLGADAAQGYVIARPMPASQMTEWLGTRRPPALPDRHRPNSRLARLARLLVWEEHLELFLGEVTAFGRGAGIKLADGQHADSLADLSSFAWLASFPSLPNTFREMAVPFPFGSVDPRIQKALAEAAVNHGTRSVEYGAARQELVAALSGG